MQVPWLELESTNPLQASRPTRDERTRELVSISLVEELWSSAPKFVINPEPAPYNGGNVGGVTRTYIRNVEGGVSPNVTRNGSFKNLYYYYYLLQLEWW